MTDSDSKRCSQCQIIKPYNDFYKNTRNKSGIEPRCKICAKKSNSEYHIVGDGPHTWTTENEKKFILGMIKTRDDAGKIRILRKYIYSLELRSDWGEISKIEIYDFVDGLLDELPL